MAQLTGEARGRAGAVAWAAGGPGQDGSHRSVSGSLRDLGHVPPFKET